MTDRHLLDRPLFARFHAAQRYMQYAIEGGLSHTTLMTYADSLQDFLAFWVRYGPAYGIEAAVTEDIRAYIHDLSHRPIPPGGQGGRRQRAHGLSRGTVELRVTVLRQLYDFLRDHYAEDIARQDHEPRPAYMDVEFISTDLLRAIRGGVFDEDSPPLTRQQPWLPTAAEWAHIVELAAHSSLRSEAMLRLAYDAALRREELVALRLTHLNRENGRTTVTVETNTTQGRIARAVPIATGTDQLLERYLVEEREAIWAARKDPTKTPDDHIFLSDAQRNRGARLSPLRWSQIVAALASAAQAPLLTTMTPRLLRLTDLASTMTSTSDLAPFAGHTNRTDLEQYFALARRRTKGTGAMTPSE